MKKVKMNRKMDDSRAAAKVFKALAHPSRLLMVLEIGRKDRTVGELAALVGADISTVSRHLGVLTAAGVLKPEKRGSSVYYKLVMDCVLGFYECVSGEISGKRRCGRLKRK
jgi:ArsR family transcriptional regulator